MPFTVNKKLSVQTAGSASGTWGAGGTTGSDLNTGVMGPLDTILAGLSTFAVSGATVALDFIDGGGGATQNCMWRFTGAMLQNAVASPNVGDATTYLKGFYFFENITTGSYTISLTTAQGSVVLPQGRRGCVFIDGTNAPRITAMVGSSTADPIPTGTVMLFYQNAAPAGWTIVASQNNKAMRVVSSAGGVAGGSNSFSTVMAQTTVGSTILVEANLPSHQHFVAVVDTSTTALTTASQKMTTIGTDYNLRGTTLGTSNTGLSSSVGSGTAHNHTITLDMQYIDVILASRD